MAKQPKKINDETQKTVIRLIALFAGIVSKELFEWAGMVVDYKINGEPIQDIEKMQELDISERLKLAIREERFEDAAALKKLLESKKQPRNP